MRSERLIIGRRMCWRKESLLGTDMSKDLEATRETDRQTDRQTDRMNEKFCEWDTREHCHRGCQSC